MLHFQTLMSMFSHACFVVTCIHNPFSYGWEQASLLMFLLMPNQAHVSKHTDSYLLIIPMLPQNLIDPWQWTTASNYVSAINLDLFTALFEQCWYPSNAGHPVAKKLLACVQALPFADGHHFNLNLTDLLGKFTHCKKNWLLNIIATRQWHQ